MPGAKQVPVDNIKVVPHSGRPACMTTRVLPTKNQELTVRGFHNLMSVMIRI